MLILDDSKALTEGNMYLHYCVKDHFALLCCDSFCIMYVNQCIQIKWNSMITEKHGIANGVNQGRVLSPILFNIYMDNLIKRLKDSNIGCKIGNNYVGVFCHAVILLFCNAEDIRIDRRFILHSRYIYIYPRVVLQNVYNALLYHNLIMVSCADVLLSVRTILYIFFRKGHYG